MNEKIDMYIPSDDSKGTTHLSGMYKDWFLDYASYVILERAVPNINDGLKPVQRRILHSMREMEDGRYNKVANIIGNTMKYHPHGDASIGDALVQLGQKDFLIDCQGNWGNIYTGDKSAAARYIESRLTKFALEVVFNPKTTNWLNSYDGRNKEPEVLPVKFPLLLLQGVEGIAVGLACKIVPHNFIELIDASISILKGKDFNLYPDFPTSGYVDVSNYNEGVKGGRIKLRAKINRVDNKTLSITELPFSTTTNSLIESILRANSKGKIKIKKVEDNTSKEVEIVIHLPAGTSSEKAIDGLYAFTDCETSISPNSCVIENDRPVFLGVKEILRKSTELTLQLLRNELEIKKFELEEKWQQLSLENLFIENKVYVKLHGLDYDEAIKLTFSDILKLTASIKLVRDIEREDIIKLLEIRMRRITKHDSQEATDKLLEIKQEIANTNNNLDNINTYTIDYFKLIKKKYGKGRERKTKIVLIDNIDAVKVAITNTKLYVNRKEGFVGYELNKKEAEFVSECSDIDDIIVIAKSGKMAVTKIQKKSFVAKDIVYVGVWKRGDNRSVYNMVYRDGKDGVSFMKRFAVPSITRDTFYDLTKGTAGSKILYLSANSNGEAEKIQVKLKPSKVLRKLILDIDFSELLIKAKSAVGNILTKSPVHRVVLKQVGQSTLGAREFWFDSSINKINVDKIGEPLGVFDVKDKIVEITSKGTLRVLEPDLLLRFSEDVKYVVKLNSEKPITIIYFDGIKKHYFIKRAIIKATHNYTSFITNHPESKLIAISFDSAPKIEITFPKKNDYQRPSEQFDANSHVTVKGLSSLGNRLSRYLVHKAKFVTDNIEKKVSQKKFF